MLYRYLFRLKVVIIHWPVQMRWLYNSSRLLQNGQGFPMFE